MVRSSDSPIFETHSARDPGTNNLDAGMHSIFQRVGRSVLDVSLHRAWNPKGYSIRYSWRYLGCQSGFGRALEGLPASFLVDSEDVGPRIGFRPMRGLLFQQQERNWPTMIEH